MSKRCIFLQEGILGRQDRLIFPTWLACQNTGLTCTFSVSFFKNLIFYQLLDQIKSIIVLPSVVMPDAEALSVEISSSSSFFLAI